MKENYCNINDMGLTQKYGIERNCGFLKSDCELCKECMEYAKLKQIEFIKTFKNKDIFPIK